MKGVSESSVVDSLHEQRVHFQWNDVKIRAPRVTDSVRKKTGTHGRNSAISARFKAFSFVDVFFC